MIGFCYCLLNIDSEINMFKPKLKMKVFTCNRSMRWLYKLLCNSISQLTSLRLDKWRQLSRWWTSTSLCIGGSTAFKINEKDQQTLEINERYARKITSSLFGVYRKLLPSESSSGITRQSLMMPDSDPWEGFFYTCH